MRPLLILFCSLIAVPAFAQSYVVGSFGVDVSRLGRVEGVGFEAPRRDGEAIGGALRLGTSLSDRWGVELEFARSATLEDETTLFPRILPADPRQPVGFTFSSTSPGVVPIGSPIGVDFRQRLEQRHQTIGALAWIQQPVGSRVDLVYLGGLGFWRTTREQQVSFILPIRPAILPPSQTTQVTSYGSDPIVGVEARIGLTDHVRLVPGMRLQGIGDAEGSGWLLRAGVGLGWFF